jgi:hypothetical protein
MPLFTRCQRQYSQKKNANLDFPSDLWYDLSVAGWLFRLIGRL